jgi:hypothetical protein
MSHPLIDIKRFHFARFLLHIFDSVISIYLSFFFSHLCVINTMWKTRFEVSTHNGNDLTRHRTLSSSSKIINHHYSSRSLPKVPRVREDSPSAIVRPSPPSSIPNLDIVTEEDEDIPYSNTIDNEQPNLIRKQFSYQNLNKRQIVLPTIIESNDYDTNNESIDDRHNKYVIKTQDSFVGTNTNYNQVRNIDIERKERILNTNKNNDTIGFTLDKRINELIQQKRQRQNKVREIMLVFAASACQ